MVLQQSCPKCRGKILLEYDEGKYTQVCLNCGWQPIRTLEELHEKLNRTGSMARHQHRMGY